MNTKLCKYQTILLGGGSQFDHMAALRELLRNHGVPDDLVHERAATTIEKLGRATILNIFRGTSHWKDLKSAANHLTPKLQLVLAPELEDVIKKRASFAKPVATKKDKKYKPVTRPAVQLQASDIQVPDGIFREGINLPLKQLEVSQIGPDARGIIVVDPFEAVPYMKRLQKVSTRGLAMVVIGAQLDLMHGVGQVIRFPAKCRHTDEALILSAHLLQLGAVEVVRNTAENAPKVDEVSNQVLKVLAFKDEMGPQWTNLLDKPVRFVLDNLPELKEREDGTRAILDVWDRQWLNARMEKVQQDKAELFSVCIRITGVDVKAVMQRSGQTGQYYEPKALDGRGHSDEYRVIWLNKLAKPDAVVQCQSIKQWSCLVRSNQRFGVRVLTAEAETVHHALKPHTPFLTGTDHLQFVGGPFPYGATRQSLASLFKGWGWNAKPCQPKSRSSDGRGVLWTIQSVGKPPYDVYQMDHADILLSECPKRGKQEIKHGAAVQASARTIDALKAGSAAKPNRCRSTPTG